MRGMISPSMMCCDLLTLSSTLKEFERLEIDYLHVDIMDGHFVPNYTLGTDYVRMLRENTSIPLDIHMMVTRPEERLDWFDFGPADFVSIHAESTPHIHRAISKIKDKGARAMLAINPGTPLLQLEPVIDDLDGVLIMTVDPGFAGQQLVPGTLRKIRALKEWLAEIGNEHVLIEVDGNVNVPNAERMRAAGADIFVVGSSGFFLRDLSFEDAAGRLRAVIG